MHSVPEHSVEELQVALDAGAPLLDVREDDEWLEERVEGGLHVPLGDVADRVDDITSHVASAGGGNLWVICAGGGRSMKAAEFLASQGVTTINVAGGTKEWVAAGKPFSSGAAE